MIWVRHWAVEMSKILFYKVIFIRLSFCLERLNGQMLLLSQLQIVILLLIIVFVKGGNLTSPSVDCAALEIN